MYAHCVAAYQLIY